MTFERQRAAPADVVAIPVTPFTEDGSVDRETCRPARHAHLPQPEAVACDPRSRQSEGNAPGGSGTRLRIDRVTGLALSA
ncbi:hypothetical protein SHL15_1885 [Streptomyces hygroscopicus subsp. limoneus]|nr:hypothetical protein SHL15_1885 [Streptomyces hygroscopicus subsp. limoneus]